MTTLLKYLVLVLLTFFGLLTVFLTLSIIFNLFDIREKEGDYVSFVVYTNLTAGLSYLLAAYLNWKHRKSGAYLLLFTSLLLLLTWVVLLIYINRGGTYEAKTPMALLFRIIVTAVLSVLSFYVHSKFIIHKTKKS